MKKRTIKNSASKTDKQKFLTEFLTAISRTGLPEHESPFKLYFNDMLIGSSKPPQSNLTTKNEKNENIE